VERDDGPCLSDGRAYGCSDVSDEDGRPTSIDNGYDIPDWCPLPEAEDDDGGVARTLARLDEMERLRARNAELKAALRDAGG